MEKVYRSDDIFSLWDIGREQLITHFLKKQIVISLQLTSQQKSLKTKSHSWIRLCTKPTKTFQYTHFSSCHPNNRGQEKALSKAKPSNYSEQIPQNNIFKKRFLLKEFQQNLITWYCNSLE